MLVCMVKNNVKTFHRPEAAVGRLVVYKLFHNRMLLLPQALKPSILLPICGTTVVVP